MSHLRPRAIRLLSLIYVCVSLGCTDRECLPIPAADASPPEIRMTLVYGPRHGAVRDTLLVTPADSSIYIDARADERVRVTIAARDPEGLRRLQLGATELTTLGMGLESKRIPVEAVHAACPRADLRFTWISPPPAAGSSVTVAVVAENWAGLFSATETVTLKLH